MNEVDLFHIIRRILIWYGKKQPIQINANSFEEWYIVQFLQYRDSYKMAAAFRAAPAGIALNCARSFVRARAGQHAGRARQGARADALPCVRTRASCIKHPCLLIHIHIDSVLNFLELCCTLVHQYYTSHCSDLDLNDQKKRLYFG